MQQVFISYLLCEDTAVNNIVVYNEKCIYDLCIQFLSQNS